MISPKTTMFLVTRKWTILSILIITPIGFSTKLYSGPISAWVNNSLGGILYVLFWALLFFLILPKISTLRIACTVFIATCMIEVLQLWHPLFLEAVRHNFIGRTILGNSFSLSDLFHYGIGLIISILWIKFLRSIE